jgi:hypothetical protein
VSETNGFEGWAILELMGHRKLAGKLSEQTIGGCAMVRIDVPGEGDTTVATQFYSGAAIYCVTPTTEAIARKVANHYQPTPVTPYEMADRPALAAHATSDDDHLPW